MSKIKLYPTVSQKVILLDTLEICKDAWNALKRLIQERYQKTRKTTNYYEIYDKIQLLKRSDKKYITIYSQVLHNVSKRLIASYRLFFTLYKKGYKTRLPRYKSLEHYHSFTYPQKGFMFTDNRVKLSKIGSIKYRGTIPKGKIKTFTVKHVKSGKWFGYITYEKTLEPYDANLPTVGIDLGLEKFATMSDGNYIPIPQFYRRDEKRVKKAHRELSRKKRGSKNREKARQKLATVYEKISNRRLDFLHKVSTWVADHYSVVYVEDLNIKGISRGLRLGKSVHDASWGRFLTLLEYKLSERNGLLIKVDPRYTSQLCSNCGGMVKKGLGDRIHDCPICGLTIDRDLNASRNILKVGTGGAELTPAESDTSASTLFEVSVLHETGIINDMIANKQRLIKSFTFGVA